MRLSGPGGKPPVIPAVRSDSMPPTNVECEAAVLASIMRDNPMMHEVAQILEVEDFSRANNAMIFRAIRKMYDQGKAFDAMLVADELIAAGEFQAAGGHEYLSEIFENGTASACNAAYYAQIVRQKSLARQLIEAGNETLQESFSGMFTAEELLSRAEQRIFAVAQRQIGSSTKDGKALADLGWQQIKDRLEGFVGGIGSGYPELDAITDGFKAANLIILAARPSQGKTALAMNMCENVVMKAGAAVLFVSLEMKAGELTDRLYASLARIPSELIKDPEQLTGEQMSDLAEARTRLSASRLFVEDSPTKTMTQLAALARFHKAKNNIAILAVDYLSLIDGQARRGESRQEEVARISRQLKALARELSIPLLVLHQLNRQSENREDRRPRISDLRESGQIEQDADLILLLHRPEHFDPTDRPGEADILVAKNRCGKTGPVKLAFIKELTRFERLAHPSRNDTETWRD